MSLRTRLSIAFFVLLLGPLMLAAVTLRDSIHAPSTQDHSRAVRAVVSVHCGHLEIAAQALALTAAARSQAWVANPADAVGPWAICGVPQPVSAARGLAARAEIRDARGDVSGYAYAVAPVDPGFLAELSAAAGTRVVPADGTPGLVPLETYDDQPLPLATEAAAATAPSPVPAWAAVVGGVLLAALCAWWLGTAATRPLRVLLGTVERVAAGDLSVRSQMSGRDETGLLGTGLDRLIDGMQETQRLSVTDELTGLGNHRHLTASLRREIERATRFGRALGVLMIDLDHFKIVNDRYGHRAGDAVLAEFAQRVREVIREVDLAFRQGGEEFAVLLPETDVPGSLTAARRVGEAVRDVAFPIVGGGYIPVTVSIGVAVFPRHALTGAELLDAADQALYAAKEAGRDTFVLAGTAIPEQWVRSAVPTVVDPGGASGGTTSARSIPGG